MMGSGENITMPYTEFGVVFGSVKLENLNLNTNDVSNYKPQSLGLGHGCHVREIPYKRDLCYI